MDVMFESHLYLLLDNMYLKLFDIYTEIDIIWQYNFILFCKNGRFKQISLSCLSKDLNVKVNVQVNLQDTDMQL